MEEVSESIWNFDGAQFYILFTLKDEVRDALDLWDLEKAYWKVRLLRMELDAKLKRKEKHKLLAKLDEEQVKRGVKSAKTEKEEVDELMSNVDKAHVEFVKLTNPSETQRSTFFNILESFYMELCYIMKKKGMYYREGEDNRLAVLRR